MRNKKRTVSRLLVVLFLLGSTFSLFSETFDELITKSKTAYSKKDYAVAKSYLLDAIKIIDKKTTFSKEDSKFVPFENAKKFLLTSNNYIGQTVTVELKFQSVVGKDTAVFGIGKYIWDTPNIYLIANTDEKVLAINELESGILYKVTFKMIKNASMFDKPTIISIEKSN